MIDDSIMISKAGFQSTKINSFMNEKWTLLQYFKVQPYKYQT